MGIWIIMAVCVLGFAVLGLINWWSHRGPTLTGPAAVVCTRVEYGKAAGAVFTGKSSGSNCWNYYVTFRLLDGEELELAAMEHHFLTLKEGMHGQLTWCREHLYDFEEDPAEGDKVT